MPTLFDYEAVKQLYKNKPVRIQENIYSFRGDRFEHGLIIKSYSSDLISTTVSGMPFELLCLFMDSGHPALMAALPSFPKPQEWHFAEGDEVYVVGNPDKFGVISMLRSDSVELSTEEGIVCVPWLKIRKVLRIGDYVEVTGGMYLGRTGWVGGLHDLVGTTGDTGTYTYMELKVANIIQKEDKEKPSSDHIQVFPIPFECSAPVLIFPSDDRRVRQFIKACCCSSHTWNAPAG
jgi:hypothetical protein